MFKKTLLIAGTSYFLVQRKTYCTPEPPLSMILRGSYENKIRRYSPPQKIFDVFATIYDNGNLLMSLNDLLKAICFYNFSISDQTHIEGFKSPSIIKFLGKDDKFEIYDYFLLARFLAFQTQQVQAYFKKKVILQINQKQFSQFLSNQICADYVDYIKKGILMESRQFHPKKQDFDKKIKIVAKSMFQNVQVLTSRDINQKRKEMIQQLYEFQFKMFPIQDEKIDGADFARSIIKYVQPNKTKKYMKRIKKMPQLQNVKVDISAYKAFHTYMWQNMTEIQHTINQKGAISTRQLSTLINKFVNKGSVTHQQIDAIVKVLDWDDSGFLQKKQVLGVLKHMQYYTTVKSGEVTFFQSLKNDFEKLYSKFNQIKQIIQE